MSKEEEDGNAQTLETAVASSTRDEMLDAVVQSFGAGIDLRSVRVTRCLRVARIPGRWSRNLFATLTRKRFPVWIAASNQEMKKTAPSSTGHPDGGYLVLAGVQVAPSPILAMVVDGSNVLADGAAPVRRIVMVRELNEDFFSFQVQLYMLYLPGGFDAQDLTVEVNVSHGSEDRRFDGYPQDNLWNQLIS